MINAIDLVLKSVNIIDIVSQYIPLKKAGANYKARCPFHEEKTASFNVSETKQIYKCFGCGRGGNAISFVSEYEKISFFEALKKLGDKVGIAVTPTEATKKINSKRDLIYTIYELASEFYVQNFHKYSSSVMPYLEKRQLSLEVATKFHLGYALDSFSGLKMHLQRNHINARILPDTGLFRFHESNPDPYDLFRERLIFPIHNTSGKVVAFGGRALDAGVDKGFKYINSPTTDIYTKGKELYGLHITRFEIAKRDFAFICEGYMDFLRLYEKGYTNNVASLGTALTIDQINLLKRYTKNIFLLYDGDDAGITAAVKASALIIQQGATPKVVLLPDKLDPDDFLLNHSTEDFDRLVATALPLCRLVKSQSRLYPDTREAIQMLIDISPEISDEITRELFIKEISQTFGIDEIKLAQSVTPKREYIAPVVPENNTGKQSEERKLLKLLSESPEQIAYVASTLAPENFLNEAYQTIYKFFCEIEDKSIISDAPALCERFKEWLVEQNEWLVNELIGIMVDKMVFSESVNDLVMDVRTRKLNEQLKLLNIRYKNDPDNSEILEEKYLIKEELKKNNNKNVTKLPIV
jgi:DNA primase